MKYEVTISFSGKAIIDVDSDYPCDVHDLGMDRFWYMFKQAKPFADLDIEVIDYNIYEM